MWLYAISIAGFSISVVFFRAAGGRYEASTLSLGIGIGFLAGALFAGSTYSATATISVPEARVRSIEGIIVNDVFSDQRNSVVTLRPINIETTGGGTVSASSDGFVVLEIVTPVAGTLFSGAIVRIDAVDFVADASIRFSSSVPPLLHGYRSLPYRIRSRVYATVEKMRSRFGFESRALFGALFLGKKDPSLDDLRYFVRRAGCIHLFALSGMHVGVLIVILSVLFRPIFGRKGARYLSVPVIVCYVFLIGSPPALLRAGSMFVFATVLRGASRRARQIDIISAAVLISLFADPYSIQSASFALTFLAVLAIVSGSKTWSLLLKKYVPKLLATPLSISLAAFFGTAWYVSISFGETYPFGIISSMILGPMVVLFLGATTILLGFEYLIPHRGFSFDKLYQSTDLLAVAIRRFAVELSRLPPLRITPMVVLVASIVLWCLVINWDRRHVQL